ncbi:MAG: bleomycin resistance family protein [Bacteroidetes bacterium]|jgi:uncharacterized glyoxalase superfamily protein PhnB|nr:bleomycin resistance family protein [Bacteroidota bacterium]
MSITQLTPILYTVELENSIDFYSNILGAKVNYSTENWAFIQLDLVELMLSKPNRHTDFIKAKFTGSFYFKTDNVLEFWNLIKDKVVIVYPLQEFDYGMKEFALYDNNGYVLQFGQEIV